MCLKQIFLFQCLIKFILPCKIQSLGTQFQCIYIYHPGLSCTCCLFLMSYSSGISIGNSSFSFKTINLLLWTIIFCCHFYFYHVNNQSNYLYQSIITKDTELSYSTIEYHYVIDNLMDNELWIFFYLFVINECP